MTVSWTRRRFVGALGVLTLTGGSLRAQEPKRVLRIGHILPPDAVSAARGAELGAEEAGRTAELLGARFQLVAGTSEGVFALVGGEAAGKAAERLGVPFLSTESAEAVPGRNRFYVASSPADRRAALERWRRKHPGPARVPVQVLDWHPSLARFGAEQLNQRFEKRFGAPMDEAAWASWMAVMIAAELALRHPGIESPALAERLERMRFDGHKGVKLFFRPEDHQLRQPLYVVAEDKVLGEIDLEEE